MIVSFELIRFGFKIAVLNIASKRNNCRKLWLLLCYQRATEQPWWETFTQLLHAVTSHILIQIHSKWIDIHRFVIYYNSAILLLLFANPLFLLWSLQYLSDLTQMNHSAAAAYTSMAQPFGVAAHTPPHMATVRQDTMGKIISKTIKSVKVP